MLIVLDLVQLLGLLLWLLQNLLATMRNCILIPRPRNIPKDTFYGGLPGTRNLNDGGVTPVVTVWEINNQFWPAYPRTEETNPQSNLSHCVDSCEIIETVWGNGKIHTKGFENQDRSPCTGNQLGKSNIIVGQNSADKVSEGKMHPQR